MASSCRYGQTSAQSPVRESLESAHTKCGRAPCTRPHLVVQYRSDCGQPPKLPLAHASGRLDVQPLVIFREKLLPIIHKIVSLNLSQFVEDQNGPAIGQTPPCEICWPQRRRRLPAR